MLMVGANKEEVKLIDLSLMFQLKSYILCNKCGCCSAGNTLMYRGLPN